MCLYRKWVCVCTVNELLGRSFVVIKCIKTQYSQYDRSILRTFLDLDQFANIHTLRETYTNTTLSCTKPRTISYKTYIKLKFIYLSKFKWLFFMLIDNIDFYCYVHAIKFRKYLVHGISFFFNNSIKLFLTSNK